MKTKLMMVLAALGIFVGVLSTAQAQNSSCASVTSRLRIGGQGIVLPGLPNNLRSQPSRTGASLGRIPAGGIFDVLEGPRCANGITWWNVSYRGVRGWTAEAQGFDVFVEPYRALVSTPRPTALPRATRVPAGVATTVPNLGNGSMSPAQAELYIETLFNAPNTDMSAYICPQMVADFGGQSRSYSTDATCSATGSGMRCTIAFYGLYAPTLALNYDFHLENGRLCLD